MGACLKNLSSPRFYFYNSINRKDMAKIFAAPSSIALPQWSIEKTYDENVAEEKAYLAQLKDMLVKRKPTQFVQAIQVQ